MGATQALARLLGRPGALRFLYEGKLVSADDAHRIGLVGFVVEPDRLRDEVQSYAAALAAKPAPALAGIRRTVTEGGGLTFDEGLDVERRAAVELAESAEFTRGVRAFLERSGSRPRYGNGPAIRRRG